MRLGGRVVIPVEANAGKEALTQPHIWPLKRTGFTTERKLLARLLDF